MKDSIPDGSRPVARVLLIDPHKRLLLLQAAHASDGHKFWVTPGGGVEAGESFEEAARRELLEETGLDLEVDHWVWTRRHVYIWNGRWCDQYERFFVARTVESRIRPQKQDGYVVSHRWWTLSEIRSSMEEFAPRRMADLIANVIGGNYPDPPIDCGV